MSSRFFPGARVESSSESRGVPEISATTVRCPLRKRTCIAQVRGQRDGGRQAGTLSALAPTTVVSPNCFSKLIELQEPAANATINGPSESSTWDRCDAWAIDLAKGGIKSGWRLFLVHSRPSMLEALALIVPQPEADIEAYRRITQATPEHAVTRAVSS